MSETDEFAMYAPVAPRRVLLRETHDQLPQLGGGGRSARAATGRSSPVSGNAFSVPTQQRLGCHDPALPQPARESRRDGAEQDPVVVVDRRPVDSAAQHLELVA